jgi:hypothetical protein
VITQQVVAGIGVEIDDPRRRIAAGTGAQEGDLEVRTSGNAPGTEGLTEVLVVLGQSHRAGDIDQAEHAEARVEQDPGRIGGGVMKLALQQVVDQNGDVVEIREEIAHAASNRLREFRIDLGRRLQNGPVESVVEREHRAVEALEGVRRMSVFGRDGGTAGQRGKDQHRGQAEQTVA